MAHFCRLDENNIVTQVIVVANEDTTDTNGVEVEEIGVAFCKKLLGAETNWETGKVARKHLDPHKICNRSLRILL